MVDHLIVELVRNLIDNVISRTKKSGIQMNWSFQNVVGYYTVEICITDFFRAQAGLYDTLLLTLESQCMLVRSVPM